MALKLAIDTSIRTAAAAAAMGLCLAAATPAQAFQISFDPGSVGSIISDGQSFVLTGLQSVKADGSQVVIDIVFDDMKFLDASWPCVGQCGATPGFQLSLTWSGAVNSDGSGVSSLSGFSDINGDLIAGALSNLSANGNLSYSNLAASVPYLINNPYEIYDLHYAFNLPTSAGPETIAAAQLTVYTGDAQYQVGQTRVLEPATLALFGLGLAGIGAARRKKPAA